MLQTGEAQRIGLPVPSRSSSPVGVATWREADADCGSGAFMALALKWQQVPLAVRLFIQRDSLAPPHPPAGLRVQIVETCFPRLSAAERTAPWDRGANR